MVGPKLRAADLFQATYPVGAALCLPASSEGHREGLVGDQGDAAWGEFMMVYMVLYMVYMGMKGIDIEIWPMEFSP